MADGNFNRSMLPNNSFRSGLKVGQARTKSYALESLRTLLSTHPHLQLTIEQQEDLNREFKSMLDNFRD